MTTMKQINEAYIEATEMEDYTYNIFNNDDDLEFDLLFEEVMDGIDED